MGNWLVDWLEDWLGGCLEEMEVEILVWRLVRRLVVKLAEKLIRRFGYWLRDCYEDRLGDQLRRWLEDVWNTDEEVGSKTVRETGWKIGVEE